MFIDTVSRPFQKAFTTNANSASFPSKIPTIAEPVNDGVTKLANLTGGTTPRQLFVLPYGLGTDDDVFDMKIIGWRHIGPGAPQSIPLWVPTTLVELTCTLGTATGVATAPVLDTEAFCDTIIVKSDVLQPRYSDVDATPTLTHRGVTLIYSPADNTVGWLIVDLLGMEKVEFTFDQTTNTPQTNCLIALL